MRLLIVIFCAIRAYYAVKKNHRPAYVAAVENGVPYVACLLAMDREAWQVTQFALETKIQGVHR